MLVRGRPVQSRSLETLKETERREVSLIGFVREKKKRKKKVKKKKKKKKKKQKHEQKIKKKKKKKKRKKRAVDSGWSVTRVTPSRVFLASVFNRR